MLTSLFKMIQDVERTLQIECWGWVQEIGVEFRICWWKWAVLMGMSAIVAAECRTGWMMLPHMVEIFIRPTWGITTVLTNKDLRPSLPISIVLLNTMNFSHMGLQRATLCESFFTQLTFVGTDTCKRGKIGLAIQAFHIKIYRFLMQMKINDYMKTHTICSTKQISISWKSSKTLLFFYTLFKC